MRVQSVTGENMSQKVFDYRTQEQLGINTGLDKLNPEQIQQLGEALRQIRQESQQQAAERSLKWFYAAIVPVLKDFASTTESVLELREMAGNIVEAGLRNQVGYDITDAARCMKTVMMLAVHTEIGAKDNEVLLTLTFDCNEMLE